MSSDISRIPIISISGCKSISDYVSSLPLPKNLPNSPELIDSSSKSIKLLNSTEDEALINSLVLALGSTNTDDLVFDEKSDPKSIDKTKLPLLFNKVVKSRRSVFENNRSFHCIFKQSPWLEAQDPFYVVKSETEPLKLSIKLSSMNSECSKEKEKHKKKKKSKHKSENGSVSSLTELINSDNTVDVHHSSAIKTETSQPHKLKEHKPDASLSHVFKGALLNFAPPQTETDFVYKPMLHENWLVEDKAPNSVATDMPSVNNSLHLNISSNISNPQSVGANLLLDDPLSISRSPQSLPSNYSYPATPGNISSQNPLSVPLTSPLTTCVSYSKYPPGPSPASCSNIPTSAITPKKKYSPQPISVESSNQMSGLAAYLPPSQQRDLSPQNHSETSEIGFTSLSRQINSPISSSTSWSRHRNISSGKPKGGMRKRKSELESLVSWQVKDPFNMASSRTANILKPSSLRSEFGKSSKESSCSNDDSLDSSFSSESYCRPIGKFSKKNSKSRSSVHSSRNGFVHPNKRKRGPGRPAKSSSKFATPESNHRILPSLSSDSDSSSDMTNTSNVHVKQSATDQQSRKDCSPFNSLFNKRTFETSSTSNKHSSKAKHQPLLSSDSSLNSSCDFMGNKKSKHKLTNKRHSRDMIVRTPSTIPCTDSDTDMPVFSTNSSPRIDPNVFITSDSDSEYSVLNASKRFSQECVDLEKQRVTEESCAAASSCAKFRERLCQILQRVEDLDLQSINQNIPESALQAFSNLKKTRKSKKKSKRRGSICTDSSSSNVSCDSESDSYAEDPLPRSARLTKEELTALCIETGQMRVASSLSSLPTGRLVRFLNLMLIRMRDVVRLPPKFPSTGISKQLATLLLKVINDSKEDLIDSSFLWNHSYFGRLLAGVDCALISLNLIANPDIPRNVLLDELVDAIAAIAMRLLVYILFVAPSETFAFEKLLTSGSTLNGDVTSSTNVLMAQSHLVLCLGRRVSQIVAGLASLVRLQPCKLTDNLVIRLNQLALAMPTHVIANPNGGFNQSLRHQIDNGWTLALQQASLGLLSSLYCQYDKHRKSVIDELFASLVIVQSRPQTPAVSVKTIGEVEMISNRLRTIRSFHLPVCLDDETTSNSDRLSVHALSAVILSLIQSLICAPSSGCAIPCISYPYVNISITCNTSGRDSCGGAHSNSSCSSSVIGCGKRTSSTATPSNDRFNCGILNQTDLVALAKDEKQILSVYQLALRHSQYLLTGLFKKLTTKSDEDVRPLLDTFIEDIITVSQKAPIEWPAAYTIIQILANVLIINLSLNSASVNAGKPSPVEASLSQRSNALEALTTLTIGLLSFYNDMPTSSNKLPIINMDMMSAVIGLISSPLPNLNGSFARCLRDKTQIYTYLLQLRMEHSDGLLIYAKRFHLTLWLHECNQFVSSVENLDTTALEQLRRQIITELNTTNHNVCGLLLWQPNSRQRQNLSLASSSFITNQRKRSLFYCIYTGYGLGPESRRKAIKIGLKSAKLLIKKRRTNSGSLTFDLLFSYICKSLSENSVPLRTKAIRCISAVLEKQPQLIHSWSTMDLNLIIQSRLLDASTAVREAAVDLVSRLCIAMSVPDVLKSPDMNQIRQKTFQYQEWLTNRILDKGLSVRKRAIRFFRDYILLSKSEDFKLVCLQPNDINLPNPPVLGTVARNINRLVPMSESRVTDICVKIIRRIQDEESIVKSVTEMFYILWFTPLRLPKVENPDRVFTTVLDERLNSMINVCMSMRHSMFDLLVEFVQSIMGMEKWNIDEACEQLTERICSLLYISTKQLTNECVEKEKSLKIPKAISYLMVLHLIALTRPQSIALKHTQSLIYLIDRTLSPEDHDNSGIISCVNANESSQLYHLISTVEALLNHLSLRAFLIHDKYERKRFLEEFINPLSLEYFQEHLISQVKRQGRSVVDASMSCLGVLVNPERPIINDTLRITICFSQFLSALIDLSNQVKQLLQKQQRNVGPHGDLHGSEAPIESTAITLHLPPRIRPCLLRALYAIGLMIKNISLDVIFTTAKQISSTPVQMALEQIRKLYPKENDQQRFEQNLKSVLKIMKNVDSVESLKEQIFSQLLFFARYALTNKDVLSILATDKIDLDVCKKAISGLVMFATRYQEQICNPRLVTLFDNLLKIHQGMVDLHSVLLDYLRQYLLEIDRKMTIWHQERKIRKSFCTNGAYGCLSDDSLKEMSDQQLALGSTVAQQFLPLAVDNCLLRTETQIRLSCYQFISTILKQGLVHPERCLAPLICLQTDPDSSIRSKATVQLTEIEKRCPGYAVLRAVNGIRLAYCLHDLICQSCVVDNSISHVVARGVSSHSNSSDSALETNSARSQSPPILALNHSLYALIRHNSKDRHSLVTGILRLFDPSEHTTNEDRTLATIPELIFLTDQLAHFPYLTQEEVLFLAYHAERRACLLGAGLQRAFLDSFSNIDGRENFESLIEKAEEELLNCNQDLVNQINARLKRNKHSNKQDTCLPTSDQIWDLWPIPEFSWSKKILFKGDGIPDEASWNSRRVIETQLSEQLNALRPKSVRDSIRLTLLQQAPICLLLFTIREHMRLNYGITEQKLRDFSPIDPSKQWNKQLFSSGSNSNVKKGGQGSEKIIYLPELVLNTYFFLNSNKVSSPSRDRLAVRLCLAVRYYLMKATCSEHNINNGVFEPALPVTNEANAVTTSKKPEIVESRKVESKLPKQPSRTLENGVKRKEPPHFSPTSSESNSLCSQKSSTKYSINRESKKLKASSDLRVSKATVSQTTVVAKQEHSKKPVSSKTIVRSLAPLPNMFTSNKQTSSSSPSKKKSKNLSQAKEGKSVPPTQTDTKKLVFNEKIKRSHLSETSSDSESIPKHRPSNIIADSSKSHLLSAINDSQDSSALSEDDYAIPAKNPSFFQQKMTVQDHQSRRKVENQSSSSLSSSSY